MTKASEVTVTFDEVVRFHELQEEAGTSTALAAFLAKRAVPVEPALVYESYDRGYNAAIAAVLRGPG